MVFFAMRALFALLGAFANRHPIEKWAAFAALMSAQMDEWRAGCAGGGVSTGLLREKIIFRGRWWCDQDFRSRDPGGGGSPVGKVGPLVIEMMFCKYLVST